MRYSSIPTTALLLATLACGGESGTPSGGGPSSPQPAAPTARPANPGVTDTEIRIGMNAAFTGPSAGLGIEMWRGANAAFLEANAAGGVHGRTISLVLADDGYDAERTAANYVRLIQEENVFCTGWSVGTPTMVRALPVIHQYFQQERLFHFGNFTGAQPQRRPPYREAVFNFRASYRQETAAIVNAFHAMGKRRIGVFVQDDAYGTDGREGVMEALRPHGLEIVGDTTYQRGQTYDLDYNPQVNALREANADAIVMVGSYQAAAGFIRDARKSGWDVPIHNVSFVGADQMITFLRREQAQTPTILQNLIITQVVPNPNDPVLPGVVAFRAAIDRHAEQRPAQFVGGDYTSVSSYSFGALEGYLTARVFLEILRSVGRDLTRASFIEAAHRSGAPATAPAATAEGVPAVPAAPTEGGIDIGIGVPATFTAEDHQALDRVWFTYATNDGWQTTEDVASVLTAR
jgi:branched-chain amino acid transport system substrate-binding protein